MITVIADDITGAAEIAGIGLQFGLHVSLVTETDHIPEADCRKEECDLLVYATNTRSMTEAEAVNETLRLAGLLKEASHCNLFKKTDSVLRGHVVAELKALMVQMGYANALLIPENPSRQRIIRNGIYYINNIPLEQTGFRYDPEFPAYTSDVITLLRDNAFLLSPGETIQKEGIYIANASSTDEITSFLPLLNKQTLPTGGADFFTAYLSATGNKKTASPFNGLQNNNVLIICGSTAKHPLAEFPYIQRRGIPICNMPDEVFYSEPGNEKEETDRWISSLCEIYRRNHSLIIQIDHSPREGKEFAARLREIMSHATLALLAEHLPHELIIEGGATAYTILEAAGWIQFQVENEISPGVIRMQPLEMDIHVTLKPGSYPWGENIFS